jgi:hypothetical protein
MLGTTFVEPVVDAAAGELPVIATLDAPMAALEPVAAGLVAAGLVAAGVVVVAGVPSVAAGSRPIS